MAKLSKSLPVDAIRIVYFTNIINPRKELCPYTYVDATRLVDCTRKKSVDQSDEQNKMNAQKGALFIQVFDCNRKKALNAKSRYVMVKRDLFINGSPHRHDFIISRPKGSNSTFELNRDQESIFKDNYILHCQKLEIVKLAICKFIHTQNK